MKKKILKVSLAFNTLFLCIGIYISLPFLEKFLIKRYKIVLLGDSLTSGLEKSTTCNKSDVKFSGNSGFTTSNFILILKKQVIDYKPDTCYLEGGINDIILGIPQKRTFINYQSLINTMIHNHIVPVVQSTLYTVNDRDTNNKVDSLNQFLVQLCNAQHIKFIDLNKFLSFNKSLKAYLSIDGVHLNNKGYKIWADALQ